MESGNLENVDTGHGRASENYASEEVMGEAKNGEVT